MGWKCFFISGICRYLPGFVDYLPIFSDICCYLRYFMLFAVFSVICLYFRLVAVISGYLSLFPSAVFYIFPHTCHYICCYLRLCCILFVAFFRCCPLFVAILRFFLLKIGSHRWQPNFGSCLPILLGENIFAWCGNCFLILCIFFECYKHLSTKYNSPNSLQL